MRRATIDKRLAIVRRYVAVVEDWPTATPLEVESWAAGLRISASATRDAVSHVRQFYRWAARRGYADQDPTGYVELPRRARRLPRPAREVDVAVALGASRDDPDLHAMVALMAGAGLRCVEVAMLQWVDVDPHRGTIRVDCSKHDRDRVLEVTDRIMRVLMAIDKPGRWVFLPDVADRGDWEATRAHRAQVVNRTVNRYLSRLGLPITPHQLRHRFATVALEQCGDLTVVRDLLGHENVAATEIYAKVARGTAGKVSRAVTLPELR